MFGGGDAEQVSLGAGALMNNSERHTIPVPSLSIGAYSLSWRDMGAVGHIIKGNHSFTIVGG